jgi:hypothetical protein
MSEDARNGLFVMHAYLALPKNVHFHALKFLFRNRPNLNLNPETLNASLLCKVSKEFLRGIF